MQITNLTYSISNQKYTPAFQSRACTKALQTAQSCTLGSLRDGCIGRLAIEKANGARDFLLLEKHTICGGKYETYYLKNDKKQQVGILEITIHKFIDPTLPKGVHYTDHVYVSNLRNYSRPGEEIYDNTIDEYKGIGTKFMQIALKRSEETGCNGNIELHSTKSLKENFYGKLGFVDDKSDKYYYYAESKMHLPSENKEILRQKNGGLEIILPDNRVLLSK